MKTPPLLMGATLIFWGVMADVVGYAAVMAVMLELAHVPKIRRRFPEADLKRITDLCTLIFVCLLVIQIVADRSLAAILNTLVWTPTAFFLLMLFAAYNTEQGAPLSAISIIFRAGKQKGRSGSDRLVDISYPFLVICILSAAAANLRTPWFYAGVFALTAWALAPFRSHRYPFPVWILLLTFSGVIGYAGQTGLHQLQLYLERIAISWYSDAAAGQSDPYRIRTTLGSDGELKPSRRILFRTSSDDPEIFPLLLRETVYNRLHVYDRNHRPEWYAVKSVFEELFPERDGTTWRLVHNSAGASKLTVSMPFSGEMGVLKLPSEAVCLEKLTVGAVYRNQYGVTGVEDGPGLLTYDIILGKDHTPVAPPSRFDLGIPPSEAETVHAVVEKLGITSSAPETALKRITGYFEQGFEYSLVLSSPDGVAAPVSRFLSKTRSGHCEYFASASVLMLRAAGIPARYVKGYAVHEFSELENQYLIRERDAHAWATAYVNGQWRTLDTTPEGYTFRGEGGRSWIRRLSDFQSYFFYRISVWRQNLNVDKLRTYGKWALIPLILVFLKTQLKKKRIVPEQTSRGRIGETQYLKADSPFYRVQKALEDAGYVKPESEPPAEWIKRIETSPQFPMAPGSLDELIACHYQLRFDPALTDPEDLRALVSGVEKWLEQFNRPDSAEQSAVNDQHRI